MVMGIPLKSVATLPNISIQTALNWFSGGKVVTGSVEMMVKRKLEGLEDH